MGGYRTSTHFTQLLNKHKYSLSWVCLQTESETDKLMQETLKT